MNLLLSVILLVNLLVVYIFRRQAFDCLASVARLLPALWLVIISFLCLYFLSSANKFQNFKLFVHDINWFREKPNKYIINTMLKIFVNDR